MTLTRLARHTAPLIKGLLLAWFVFVTSFAVIHNAEHGFHKHAHYGHECPIYDFVEHQNLGTGLPSLAILFLFAVIITGAISQPKAFVKALPLTVAPARGPPSRL